MAARFNAQRARRSSGRNCRSDRCHPTAALRAARAESEAGAEAAGRSLSKRGLSSDVVDQIKSEILGVS
jgi:hypothetical protein